MPTLKDTIAALFERAASGPNAEATAARGLHLKARIVDGQRQLLLSCPDVKPSDVEVSTCAKHGELAAYTVTSGPRWQLITEAADLCDHTPGFSGMGDGKAVHVYYGSCSTCHARWQRTVPRRGGPSIYTYNGRQVAEWQMALLNERGPKADRANEHDDELKLFQAVEKAIVRQQLERQPAVDTTPTLTGQVCGTCGHGTPTQFPNEVECQLGWERQDGVLRPKLSGKLEWVPIPQGHGSLALPIAHPACGCAAVLGGNRPGWVAA